MKKVEGNLYECLNSELKNFKASDFKEDTIIYIKNNVGNFLYIINLKTGEYKTFSLRSSVQNANTMHYLNSMAGNGKGFTPYYLRDFINR